MACVIHHGPHEKLSDAYEAFLRWVDASGYQVDGPNRDLYYLQTQTQETAPAVTEVQFPVRKRPFLTTVTYNKETIPMEPKIVTRPAFKVVGMLYEGKNENNEISGLWDHFIPRIDDVEDKSGDAYGVCGNVQPDGSFQYLAGIEVSQVEDQPADMSHWRVPEQTYAVFPCTLQNVRETYHHAYHNWLPQSDYERVDGPDFELYPEDFNPETGTGMYIYIPITQ